MASLLFFGLGSGKGSGKGCWLSKEEPDMSRCILCRFDGFSALFLCAELRADAALEFSCP